MKIKVLAPQVANQIAAGEIVERPSSILKELIENSIDAKATEIRIDLEKGGIDLISIRDNGVGIDKEELHLALSPHATSKLVEISDLDTLLSFGFRGEALASISSISKLILTSKTPASDIAYKVTAHGKDHKTEVTPASYDNGTMIEIRDLFFNTPARKKFLKSAAVEYNYCEDIINKISFIYPHISWTVYHNGKLRLRYPALEDYSLLKRSKQFFKDKFSDETAICLQSSVTLPFPIHLDIILELHNIFNYSQQIQYTYINERSVRDKVINSAIRQAITDYYGNKYASYVIKIDMDPKYLDFNVHPSKLEVRFSDARQMHTFVYEALYNFFQTRNLLAQPISSATDIANFSIENINNIEKKTDFKKAYLAEGSSFSNDILELQKLVESKSKPVSNSLEQEASSNELDTILTLSQNITPQLSQSLPNQNVDGKAMLNQLLSSLEEDKILGMNDLFANNALEKSQTAPASNFDHLKNKSINRYIASPVDVKLQLETLLKIVTFTQDKVIFQQENDLFYFPLAKFIYLYKKENLLSNLDFIELISEIEFIISDTELKTLQQQQRELERFFKFKLNTNKVIISSVASFLRSYTVVDIFLQSLNSVDTYSIEDFLINYQNLGNDIALTRLINMFTVISSQDELYNELVAGLSLIIYG